jgi:predicted O-methyltransferase YrrM
MEINNVINSAWGLEHTQVREDFLELCSDFLVSPRNTVMEIGTFAGCTLGSFISLQGIQNVINPLIISVDNATYPTPMTNENFVNKIMNGLKNVGCDTSNLKIIVLDSHTEECNIAIRNTLNGRKIDFAFIDADHSYNSVKQDYELCLKYMNNNSIIAFHDIYSKYDDNENIGAKLFWDEIKGNYKHREIISGITSGKYPDIWSGGIGVLYIGENNG